MELLGGGGGGGAHKGLDWWRRGCLFVGGLESGCCNCHVLSNYHVFSKRHLQTGILQCATAPCDCAM